MSGNNGPQEAWDFDRCVLVLTGEIALLREIFAAQDRVQKAVLDREWADFDEKEAELNRLGGEFAALEDERAWLFSALSGTQAEKPFYDLIMGLPAQENRELSRLYRELKMQILQMRSLSESFMAYLNEAKTMAAAYLEAVCPARGGKLYTRKGRKISQDLRSLVLNNHF